MPRLAAVERRREADVGSTAIVETSLLHDGDRRITPREDIGLHFGPVLTARIGERIDADLFGLSTSRIDASERRSRQTGGRHGEEKKRDGNA